MGFPDFTLPSYALFDEDVAKKLKNEIFTFLKKALFLGLLSLVILVIAFLAGLGAVAYFWQSSPGLLSLIFMPLPCLSFFFLLCILVFILYTIIRNKITKITRSYILSYSHSILSQSALAKEIKEFRVSPSGINILSREGEESVISTYDLGLVPYSILLERIGEFMKRRTTGENSTMEDAGEDAERSLRETLETKGVEGNL